MQAGKPNFFPHSRAAWAAGAALLLLISGPVAFGQTAPAAASSSQSAPAAAGAQTDETPAPAPKKHKWIEKDEPASASSSKAGTATPKKVKAPAKETTEKKEKVARDERTVQSKDTRAEVRREKKYNPLIGKDENLPDKQLYDKALMQENKGHYDVARLDLQTLLNTYPDSQYLMRAKLAVADCWFKEGGSAAMAQAEQEYGDFITFFPNSPEAAEAQMRMGDIYLKQMDVPDRDYAKAMKAEDQYRTMLKTYPDAPKPLLTEATQKLRDVQEVLAMREFGLGQFYASHNNFAAAIARYQTVVDTYPLFSHMDDTLIGIGDAYEAQARIVRAQTKMPEGPKAKLEEEYDGKAAAAYRQVVLEHAAAPHVEDAKDRLAAMNLPIPQPTAEQVAASDALEGSRAQYTMRKRLELLLVRKPDTVTAAQLGAPPLEDAKPTVAPTIVHQIEADYVAAFNPAAAQPAKEAAAASSDATPAPAQPTPAPAGAGAPLTLSDVGNTTEGERTTGTMSPASPASGGGGTRVGNSGASLGVDVLTPGAMTGDPVGNRASDRPAATGAPDANFGIVAPKPADNSPLPSAEAPAAAPDAVNEVQGHPQPAAQAKADGQKKKPKPVYDKNDESSSKHQKKKGVDKLNPF
ncbi:MAG TPA: outer membrane protein assembly factor BamD [Acidobacteriaceae bacterium]|nr:outer membrane protein assembly factor BamD [Acidobacteriaceae bacterium]